MAPTSASSDSAPTGVRLAVAVKRLRTRLREVASAQSLGLPVPQLAILQRLRSDGPSTAAELAEFEHVSQQAIAQSLAALKRARLVRSTPDREDSRKNRITISAAGQRLFEKALTSRNAWLVQAIDSTIGAGEHAALEKAIELLERLADADVPTR
ncbi:MAG TPA: MarR family transcriptional regulator [Gemmatimonadaceae bacterium]|jgi:DNA-binding MarR family transcriptional regulator